MKHRPEYNPKVIGKNLRRLREEKNLTVNEVSEYLRVSKQAVYHYESGKRYPQSDTMFALMELYEAELHDIIDEHTEAPGIMDISYNISEKHDQAIHGMDYIFQYNGTEIVAENVISLEKYKKQIKCMEKYTEMISKYYKAV